MFKIFVQQYDRKNSKCLGLFSNGVGVGRREGCMIEWCISSIFLAPKTFMVRMTIFKPLLLPMGRSKVYYFSKLFFYILITFFSNLNSNCSNALDLRNLQKQAKTHSVSKIVLIFHSLNKFF